MKRPKQIKLADQTPCMLIEVQGDTYDNEILKLAPTMQNIIKAVEIGNKLSMTVRNPRVLTIKDCLTNKVLTKKEKK